MCCPLTLGVMLRVTTIWEISLGIKYCLWGVEGVLCSLSHSLNSILRTQLASGSPDDSERGHSSAVNT